MDETKLYSWFLSGGTIANFEALWVARNLKFFPIAARDAARDPRDHADVADSAAFAAVLKQVIRSSVITSEKRRLCYMKSSNWSR